DRFDRLLELGTARRRIVEGIDGGRMDDLAFRREIILHLIKVGEKVLSRELVETEEAVGEDERIRRSLRARTTRPARCLHPPADARSARRCSIGPGDHASASAASRAVVATRRTAS